MTLKLFRAVWFFSMLIALANLMYVYAGLPEQITLLDEGITPVVIGKEPLFYMAMAIVALSNVMVYLFSKKLTPREDFRTWIHGLVITLNIFFVIGFSFIGLYNSAERFDFERIGFIIYSSVGLVGLWATGWPVYLVIKKLMSKQTV